MLARLTRLYGADGSASRRISFVSTSDQVLDRYSAVIRRLVAVKRASNPHQLATGASFPHSFFSLLVHDRFLHMAC